MTADGKEFTYSYLPDMPKLIAQTSSPLHTVTHVYEANRDVLTSKTNRWKNKVDNPIISEYTYIVNSLGQRTSVSTEGEAFASVPADWAWGYDVLGQVTSANEDHYSYDQIGNRRTSRKGDAADTVYTANALNQYSRIGTTMPTHDADGNQLTGLTPTTTIPARDTLSFTYNAENRPVHVGQNGEVRESYSYDHMGRRIHKGDTVTLYDGYNAIAEYKSNNRTLKTTYAWGNDLSGTAQGAGGVGGLLAVTEHDRQLPLTSYPCYDGNDNITEYLTEEGDGTIAAHYEYNAFGQVKRRTGNENYEYQFSTKSYDLLTGLCYYNYRHYDPVSGRWMGRDSMEEDGGDNLYAFVSNRPDRQIDLLGMQGVTFKFEPPDPSGVTVNIIDGNGKQSGTNNDNRTIECECECKGEGKKQEINMVCTIEYDPVITLDRKQANPKRIVHGVRADLNGIYGHEQLHVRYRSNKIKEFTKKQKNRLKNRVFSDLDNCKKRIPEIQEELTKLLTAQAFGKPKHHTNNPKGDPSRQPEDGVPYTPVEGSVILK